MDVVYCFKYAVHDLGSLLVGKGDVVNLSFLHELPQRTHSDIFHLNKDDLFVFKKLVDLNDIGVVK